MAPKWGPPTCLRQVFPDAAVPVPLRLFRELKLYDVRERCLENSFSRIESRCRRGLDKAKSRLAAQHSRIAVVDEPFAALAVPRVCSPPGPPWCRACSYSLQLKVIETMKEKRRLLPA